MAIVKEVTIKVDSKDAVKGIDSVTDALGGVEKQADDSKKAVEDVGKTAKKQSKVVKGLGTAVKGVGVALKAIGIGLIIALVAKLTEVFSQNQKVIDKFSTAMTTLSIIFNQIFDVISDVVGKISEATGGFDAFGKVISGLITIALTPLKLLFFGIVLAVKEAQLAWEQSFFGGKDKETIRELNVSILETKLNLLEVAEAAIDAGKKVANNFVEAVGEFGTAIEIISKDGINGIKEISVDAALAQAKAITEATKASRILELQQTRIREAADRDAELQRRIRDDFTKGIEIRIAANKELANVLDVQEAAEKASVQARIDNLNREQEVLGFKQERLEEIFALNTELIAIEAQQAGFRAEQEVNAIGLLKEKEELNQSISDSESERQLAKLEFESEQAETEAGKLDLLRERLELENEIILEDLLRKRELYKEDTQSRVDAENEYKAKKQVIDQAVILNDKASSEDQKKTATSLKNAKIQLAGATLNALGALAKEGSELAKGVAAAQGLMSTYQSAINSYNSLSGIPIVGPTLGGVAAGLAVVAGLANVKKILSTQTVLKSAPSGGGGQSVPKAPSFNLVQGTGSNQIAEGIQGQDPVQAFVVSSDVSTSQELDRNIVENASI